MELWAAIKKEIRNWAKTAAKSAIIKKVFGAAIGGATARAAVAAGPAVAGGATVTA